MQQKLLSVAVVCVVCAGCPAPKPTVSESARISFSQGPDGSVFFTSSEGDVRRKVNSGQVQILRTPDQGVFVDVSVCPNGKRVAVELSDEMNSELPSIVLFEFSPTSGLEELGRVNGSTPRFSQDGELFFLLPSRFVPRVGFGGNFWTDFKIMHLKAVGDEPQSVGNVEFLMVDDFAPQKSTSFYVSETKQDEKEEAVESIVRYHPDEERVNKLTDCKGAHVCSGDPGISIDGKKVVFVSDKEKAFFYSLFEVDVESGEISPIEGGDLFRFTRSPAYSRVSPESVIVLGANKFSMDGQPELAVVQLSGNRSTTLVTNEELHGQERSKVSDTERAD